VALVAAQGKTRQLRAARSWGTESTPDRPFGVEGLTKSEEARVQAANAVYATAEILMYHCFLLQIFISLENPERS
jgi:hypothetical protein